jgi:hypothetical protein
VHNFRIVFQTLDLAVKACQEHSKSSLMFGVRMVPTSVKVLQGRFRIVSQKLDKAANASKEHSVKPNVWRVRTEPTSVNVL